MKPSDFFLTSRHAFGFLIPGVILLIALALIFSDPPLTNLLHQAYETNIVAALSFLGVGFLLGILIQDPSIRLSKRLSEYWHRCIARKGESRWVSFMGKILGEPRPDLIRSRDELEAQIHEQFRSLYPLSIYHSKLHGRALFVHCKRVLAEKTDFSGKRLLEQEAEINLFGLLPLPLFVLGVGLLVRVEQLPALGLRWATSAWIWGVIIVVVTALLEAMLIYRLEPMRKEEEISALELFILLGFVGDAPYIRGNGTQS